MRPDTEVKQHDYSNHNRAANSNEQNINQITELGWRLFPARWSTTNQRVLLMHMIDRTRAASLLYAGGRLHGWSFRAGALGIVWYALWLFFVYERPSTHPTISADECKTIETKLGEAALIYEVYRRVLYYYYNYNYYFYNYSYFKYINPTQDYFDER